MVWLDRSRYAAIYGPTVGDEVRLGDTDLWIQIERDLTVGGEEAVFGGGKSIRESMAQATTTRAEGALDTVITNAIILDWWGIIRADIGIRDGRIVGIGHAGNPDISDGIDMIIGPSTDVISGEGRIVTAGAIDSHVHLLSPSQIHEALATGITTIVGGGTGPSEGSKATTVTPGRVAPVGDASCARSPARQHPAARQGQHGVDGRAEGAGARGRRRVQGARGLGLLPRRDRRVAACGRGMGTAGRAALGLAERGGLRRVDDRGDGRPIDPRVPCRRGRRRSRPRHPLDRGAAQRDPRFDEPDAPAHGQHRRRAPRHADGLPSPQPRGAGGSRVRRVPHPCHHDRRGRHPPRHRRPVGDLVRRAGDGPDRRSDHAHLAGRARHEAPSRRPWAVGCRPTTSARGAMSRSTRSTPRSPTGSRTTWGRSRSAGSPTSPCGTRSSSASGPPSSSRAARSPGPRSATRTPRSRRPSP